MLYTYLPIFISKQARYIYIQNNSDYNSIHTNLTHAFMLTRYGDRMLIIKLCFLAVFFLTMIKVFYVSDYFVKWKFVY